jgi:hypothetical protein
MTFDSTEVHEPASGSPGVDEPAPGPVGADEPASGPPGADEPAPGPVGRADDDTDPFGFPPVGTVYHSSRSELVQYDGVPTTGHGFDLGYPMTAPETPSSAGRYPPPNEVWSPPPADAQNRPAALGQQPTDVGWNRPPPGNRRSGRRMRWAAAAAIVLLGGLAVAVLLVPRSEGEATRASRTGGSGGSGGTSVSGPVGWRTTAVFHMVNGSDSVRVRAADLGDDLYRISTTGGGVRPLVDGDHDGIRLSLSPGGPAAVEIQLNTAVRWTLRLDGGAKLAQVDLTGAGVDAVDLGGGASRIDLTLPAPRGVLPVRMTGGVDQFQVRLAGGATPVRVRVQSGAGTVTLAGSTHRGIAPGRSFTAYGWGFGTAGVDLVAVAGMSALTVTDS